MARRAIDPRLRHALRESARAAPALAAIAAHVGMRTGAPAAVAEVLIRCSGDDAEARLRDAGVDVRTFLPGTTPVASGTVPLDRLDEVAELPFVHQIEASRPMQDELDRSREECRVDRLHDANPAVRGDGVVVGIVDGGIDYIHPDFRNGDGSTRILHLWDQGESSSGGGVPFGREYSRAEIDAALKELEDGGDPFALVPHRDRGAHGTHVAGIACGNGRGDGDLVGMAPAADLIVVVPAKEGGITLARSVRVFEAFRYIIDRAGGRPVAINQSQGMNGGGHSGETVLETGLDLLAREPGVAIVKSAGNEQQQMIHAGGEIEPGETVKLRLQVEGNNRLADILELWQDGDDELSVAVQPPGSGRLPFVSAGDFREQTTAAGNRVEIESDLDADDTGDTRTTIILTRGDASFIQPGRWRLHLRGDRVARGRFDVWIERTGRSGALAGEQTRFRRRSNDPTRTISTPGTARRIITAGSYVTRRDGSSASRGRISLFSSRGPTRYGLRKPEIAAPGELILSARSRDARDGAGLHILNRGTSMAAPHVAGAAALVLEVRPELTCEQVKQVLTATARRHGAAAAALDNTWGSGRLDAEAAVELARAVRFPDIREVRIESTTVVVETDGETTAAVLFNRHRRRLQLGNSEGSRTSLTLSTRHEIALGDLSSGRYFLEIVAFNEDNFWRDDDRGGELYEMTVP